MDKTDVGFDAKMFAQRFNPFSPEYGPHFREVYRHMRANCPVAHTDELGGIWVVTRYDDIARMLRDSETFSSTHADASDCGRLRARTFCFRAREKGRRSAHRLLT